MDVDLRGGEVAEPAGVIGKTTQAGMQTMQSAMHALFEHMDRFIRGLESNGHKNEGED